MHRCNCAMRQRPRSSRERIGEFSTGLASGEWILVGTWDHENWGGELPRRDWIDAVTPENPVWINRLDGHMGLANSLALELAGVDADTPDVAGGEIVRDPDGRPTGILKDNAMTLVEAAVPAARRSAARSAGGSRHALRCGERRDHRARHGRLGQPRDLPPRSRERQHDHAGLFGGAACRLGAIARRGRGQRPRRRVAAHRWPESHDGRIARFAHCGFSRALHRCTGRTRALDPGTCRSAQVGRRCRCGRICT